MKAYWRLHVTDVRLVNRMQSTLDLAGVPIQISDVQESERFRGVLQSVLLATGGFLLRGRFGMLREGVQAFRNF